MQGRPNRHSAGRAETYSTGVRMTLRLVQPGESGPAAEEIARAEAVGRKLVELVKSGGRYFVILDGDEQEASYYGDLLEIAALTEEVARQCKLAALGLE